MRKSHLYSYYYYYYYYSYYYYCYVCYVCYACESEGMFYTMLLWMGSYSYTTLNSYRVGLLI